MSSRSLKLKKRRKAPSRLKKYSGEYLLRLLNRTDFQTMARRISESDTGRPWLDYFNRRQPPLTNQEELKALAAQLTKNQLESEGHQVDPKMLAEVIERISCQFDHTLYNWSIVSSTVLLSNLFDLGDPHRPFISADGRDLAHWDQFKAYREQGLGTVFLMNHSSHFDEFILGVLLAHLNGGLPLFAAGDNMMAIESLAPFFKVGSYIVVRRGANRLTLAALFNMCRAISDIGNQQTIFLEAWHGGARSRDGSLRYPRRLVTLRGALAGEKDVIIQPVALSYSVVPEDLILAGGKGTATYIKGMRLWSNLGRVLTNPRDGLWRSLKHVYGRAYLTMPKPILLSELRQKHEDEREDMSLDEFVSLTAIREIARTKKVMASQLTARGLSRARRMGTSDLIGAMKYELDILNDFHRANFGCEPDLEDFIRQQSLVRVARDGLSIMHRRGIVAKGYKRVRGELPEVASEAGLGFYATHGDRRIYSPTADQNLVVGGAGERGFVVTYLVGHRILEDKRYMNASLTLFDPRSEVAAELGLNRQLPGQEDENRLPKNAFVTSDVTSAFRRASEVIVACPPKYVAGMARMVLENAEQGLRLVLATSGFDPNTSLPPVLEVQRMLAATERKDINLFTLAMPDMLDEILEGQQAFAVLGGPEDGRKKLLDLFKWPGVGIQVSDDPVGALVAADLGRVYALWANFLARTGEVKGPTQLGRFTAEAADEAHRLGVALGAKSESFAARSWAWTATYTAEGLASVSREFCRQLSKASKKKSAIPGQARKIHDQMREAGHNFSAYQDIRLAWRAAQSLGVETPILAEACRTIWGESEEE